jgi:UPF0716 protein FxsA
MSLVKWLFIGLFALPAAELLAFVIVASLIGWLRAAALFVGTSVVGVLVLRKSGRADLARFRAAFAQQGVRAVHLETPGVATMLGGNLLTFPGFITDAVGDTLFVPVVSRWAAGKLATLARGRGRHTRRDDRVIDLEPDEWRQIPDQRRRRRRKSKGGA